MVRAAVIRFGRYPDTYSEYPINADTRYIRFTGHGADVSTWNSIKEIELYKKCLTPKIQCG